MAEENDSDTKEKKVDELQQAKDEVKKLKTQLEAATDDTTKKILRARIRIKNADASTIEANRKRANAKQAVLTLLGEEVMKAYGLKDANKALDKIQAKAPFKN